MSSGYLGLLAGTPQFFVWPLLQCDSRLCSMVRSRKASPNEEVLVKLPPASCLMRQATHTAKIKSEYTKGLCKDTDTHRHDSLGTIIVTVYFRHKEWCVIHGFGLSYASTNSLHSFMILLTLL